jgi:hypothetical protein
MMLKSSPTVKKAVKAAMARMAEGKFDKPKTRADTDALMASRRKERNAQSKRAAKKDAADLPNLQKQQADMEATFNKGKNYQYADREHNLSDEERTSRDMQGSMNQMAQRIQNVKNYGYKQGGKISLKDCSVSTAPQGKKSSCW